MTCCVVLYFSFESSSNAAKSSPKMMRYFYEIFISRVFTSPIEISFFVLRNNITFISAILLCSPLRESRWCQRRWCDDISSRVRSAKRSWNNCRSDPRFERFTINWSKKVKKKKLKSWRGNKKNKLDSNENFISREFYSRRILMWIVFNRNQSVYQVNSLTQSTQGSLRLETQCKKYKYKPTETWIPPDRICMNNFILIENEEIHFMVSSFVFLVDRCRSRVCLSGAEPVDNGGRILLRFLWVILNLIIYCNRWCVCSRLLARIFLWFFCAELNQATNRLTADDERARNYLSERDIQSNKINVQTRDVLKN